MLVDVTDVVWEGESIAYGFGFIQGTDERIKFAGDWRPMRAIADMVYEGETPTVEVDPWAVLQRF